jgi:hypothetical protein
MHYDTYLDLGARATPRRKPCGQCRNYTCNTRVVGAVIPLENSICLGFQNMTPKEPGPLETVKWLIDGTSRSRPLLLRLVVSEKTRTRDVRGGTRLPS